jgi:hypothetical protein
MAVFAMFSFTSLSLLAFDQERLEGYWYTIYGIVGVPCGMYMREILDPVSSGALRPCCRRSFSKSSVTRWLNQ